VTQKRLGTTVLGDMWFTEVMLPYIKLGEVRVGEVRLGQNR
jgi:hypothetical protein